MASVMLTITECNDSLHKLESHAKNEFTQVTGFAIPFTPPTSPTNTLREVLFGPFTGYCNVSALIPFARTWPDGVTAASADAQTGIRPAELLVVLPITSILEKMFQMTATRISN